MRYHTVFWDFNGTVADDVTLGIRCVNQMLARRSLPILPDIAAYHAVFCFPVREYYRRIGFDFSREPYEELAAEWVDLYLTEERELRLNDGFIEVSDALRSAGVRQIILSSSESGMLHRQLAQLGITDRLDAVYGLDNFYAGGKTEMARRCLGGSAAGSVMIGDTPHDADTARAIGADCILFAGGHSSRSALEACGFPVTERLCDLPPLLA